VETEEELSALFNPYLPIKMFVKQRSSFVCWQFFVCISQMVTTWIGFTTFNVEQDFLGCRPDGHVWVYLRGWGDFFITFHIVMVFFQASMAMSVFYRIPSKFGYFDRAKNPPKKV